MSTRKRRPSLLGGLLWCGLGVIFLLHNLSIGPNFWSLISRYWPILLILLGLGKVIDYFRQKEGVSIRIGEVIGIAFLLLIGTAITKIANSNFSRVLREIPIEIGGASVRPGHWIGTSYSYSEEKTYSISTATPLRIENSYGTVSVSPGGDGEIRVRLRKVIYTGEEARAKVIANEIRLEAGPENLAEAETSVKAEAEPKTQGRAQTSVFVVKTNRDSLGSRDYRFNTEMEVSVPKKFPVTIRNSFGELRAVNLEGKLDLSTTHSPLEARDCIGEVLVSNRYAESRLSNLTGNITVEARGRVHMEMIKGDVNVRNEYSPVEIMDVDGKVSVTNTDSSVTVDKVSKPVVIEAQGCTVIARNLSEALKVVASHKRVQISDVSSSVSLETRYSTLSLKDIKGNVDVASNSDRITAESIGGYLKVKAEGSEVHANVVGGPVEIQTTRKDVAVNNFEGACKVTNEYGDVTLSTGTVGKGELNVKNRNGVIQLFLPEDAGFQIDATARNGRVNSDFPGLESAQSPGAAGFLKGKMKAGEPKIVLETEYSNIYLRTRSSDERTESNKERKKERRTRQTV